MLYCSPKSGFNSSSPKDYDEDNLPYLNLTDILTDVHTMTVPIEWRQQQCKNLQTFDQLWSSKEVCTYYQKTLSRLRWSRSSFYEVVLVHYSEFPHQKFTEIPSDVLDNIHCLDWMATVVPKPTNYWWWQTMKF